VTPTPGSKLPAAILEIGAVLVPGTKGVLNFNTKKKIKKLNDASKKLLQSDRQAKQQELQEQRQKQKEEQKKRDAELRAEV
jgi:hypothetical protein